MLIVNIIVPVEFVFPTRQFSFTVVPSVEVKLGGDFVDDPIHEFDIVYLECEIKPDRRNVHRVMWYSQKEDFDSVFIPIYILLE